MRYQRPVIIATVCATALIGSAVLAALPASMPATQPMKTIEATTRTVVGPATNQAMFTGGSISNRFAAPTAPVTPDPTLKGRRDGVSSGGGDKPVVVQPNTGVGVSTGPNR